MELETSIVLAFVAVFLAVISLAIFRQWNATNAVSIRTGLEREYGQTIYQLQQQNEKLGNAAANWKARYRRGWDIYPEDDDPEIDPDLDDEVKLSEIAKIIYPKLPPALGKLIDQPGLQQAIAAKAQKNPELISTIIDKFLPKETSNSQPPLKETYA